MRNFKALRVIASTFSVLGFLSIVVTVIFLVAAIKDIVESDLSPTVILLLLLAGAISALIFFAISETILVFLQIEINTRRHHPDSNCDNDDEAVEEHSQTAKRKTESLQETKETPIKRTENEVFFDIKNQNKS